MSIVIKAFRTGNDTMVKNYPDIDRATTVFDGYAIDYMNINVDLTKQQDFDDLIKLLQIHKYCFWKKPEKVTNISLNKPI